MARLLAFVALALLASAVVADFAYEDNQVDELNRRIALCVRRVPPVSDFNRPSDICRFEGIDKLFEGALKEDVTPVVVACLVKRSVAAEIVAQVQECLTEAMARSV